MHQLVGSVLRLNPCYEMGSVKDCCIDSAMRKLQFSHNLLSGMLHLKDKQA